MVGDMLEVDDGVLQDGDESAVCFEAGDKVAMCFGAGIKDGKRWQRGIV
jgi:hypothetical protein